MALPTLLTLADISPGQSATISGSDRRRRDLSALMEMGSDRRRNGTRRWSSSAGRSHRDFHSRLQTFLAQGRSGSHLCQTLVFYCPETQVPLPTHSSSTSQPLNNGIRYPRMLDLEEAKSAAAATLTVALVGNPNTGKSTFFSASVWSTSTNRQLSQESPSKRSWASIATRKAS